MRNHGIWFSHKAYRIAGLGNLAEDLCNLGLDAVCEKRRRSAEFRWITEDAKIANFVQTCAYRYFRYKKIKPTIPQWNELCELISRRCSGNPSSTFKSAEVSAVGIRKPQNVLVNFDNESYLFVSVTVPWRRFLYAIKDRAKKLSLARQSRVEKIITKEAFTCKLCKKHDQRKPHIAHVCNRYISIPTTKLFHDFATEINELCSNYEYGFSGRLPKINGISFDPSLVKNKEALDIVSSPGEPILCVSCWNKQKAIAKSANEADHFRYMAAKIQRERKLK